MLQPRNFWQPVPWAAIFLSLCPVLLRPASGQESAKPSGDRPMKIGIIGLDTSHAVAFTKLLNDPEAADDLAGCRVVAAYPHGSRNIESSYSRIPKYTEEVQELGVEVVDSIEALLKQVDAVLLETNDGNPHFEQALQVMQAGKPVFVDKPVAASLVDVVAIFRAGEMLNVPVFSSSSLRYLEQAQAARRGDFGEVLGCEAYSPCSLEPSHPDLFWYGIHGVETLYTVMGPGCQEVQRVSTPSAQHVTGVWNDGRIGTFRGLMSGARGYGGLVYAEKGIEAMGPYRGYRPLVVAIVKFFRSGKSPVEAAETIELYAFMEAADESKRRGGAVVRMNQVLQLAEHQAERKLKTLGVASQE